MKLIIIIIITWFMSILMIIEEIFCDSAGIYSFIRFLCLIVPELRVTGMMYLHSSEEKYTSHTNSIPLLPLLVWSSTITFGRKIRVSGFQLVFGCIYDFWKIACPVKMFQQNYFAEVKLKFCFLSHGFGFCFVIRSDPTTSINTCCWVRRTVRLFSRLPQW